MGGGVGGVKTLKSEPCGTRSPQELICANRACRGGACSESVHVTSTAACANAYESSQNYAHHNHQRHPPLQVRTCRLCESSELGCGVSAGSPGLRPSVSTRLFAPVPSPFHVVGRARRERVGRSIPQPLAITADGAVWSWGQGGLGQLGHGDWQGQSLPKKVEALAGRRVVAVSAGGEHSLALTADGAVWSWGYGGFGKLGHGDEQRQLRPKKVEALAGQRVVAVSAGAYHNLSLTADGSVWSWGDRDYGKLGHGSDRQNQLLPKKVEALAGRRVVGVSAGGELSLALTADGAVWSWGMEAGARWATATSRTGCCRRRSRRWLASASSLYRLDSATASPSPPTVPSLPGARARPGLPPA